MFQGQRLGDGICERGFVEMVGSIGFDAVIGYFCGSSPGMVLGAMRKEARKVCWELILRNRSRPEALVVWVSKKECQKEATRGSWHRYERSKDATSLSISWSQRPACHLRSTVVVIQDGQARKDVKRVKQTHA